MTEIELPLDDGDWICRLTSCEDYTRMETKRGRVFELHRLTNGALYALECYG